MLSLLVALCTFRKQWTFLELLHSVDEIFTKDFALITPKKIFRTISLFMIALLNVMLIVLVAITYYVYSLFVGIPSWLICISYYLANLPYYSVVLIFYFCTNAIERRFYYVNCIMRQVSSQDIPKDVFEVCSRTTKNDRHTPTIALNEIYSIYGGQLKKNLPMSPPNKGFKSKHQIEKEIKKLTSKLERREENSWDQFKNRNKILIEEFRLAKMDNADQIIEHLTKLLDVHDILLDCLSLQNTILSIQILSIVAQIFVFEVFALFSLYRTLYNTAIESNVLAFGNAFWFTIYFLILYYIMSISATCVNEGKLTGTVVHKIINKIAGYADPRVVEKVRKLIMESFLLAIFSSKTFFKFSQFFYVKLYA